MNLYDKAGSDIEGIDYLKYLGFIIPNKQYYSILNKIFKN